MDRGQAGSLQEGLLGKGIEACRSPVAGPARVQGVLNFKEVRFFFAGREGEVAVSEVEVYLLHSSPCTPVCLSARDRK